MGESADIYKIGFGFNVDLDYKLLVMEKNSLSPGVGTGLFFDLFNTNGSQG